MIGCTFRGSSLVTREEKGMKAVSFSSSAEKGIKSVSTWRWPWEEAVGWKWLVKGRRTKEGRAGRGQRVRSRRASITALWDVVNR